MADDTEVKLSIKHLLTDATEEENFPPSNNEGELKPGDDLTSKPDDDLTSKPSSAQESEAEKNSPNRASPEPVCSICLGQLQNKSFTDSCYHTFCFTCLLEWSKVKAECPLCKVHFKSIVHNVRSIKDFDQYYITRTNPRNSWQNTSFRRSRFRFNSTLTSDRVFQRSRQRITSFGLIEYQQHRYTYAPHSLRSHPALPHPEERPAPLNMEFRRRVYIYGYWATQTSERVRDTSPEFFTENPACTHRLIPWLTRELTVLLNNNEHRVVFVLEFIMSLILRYSIQSKEFFLHIQSYLGERTSHFVNEFHVFASSVYDMERYDEHYEYDVLSTLSSSTTFSSPNSDVVPIGSSSSDDEFPLSRTRWASPSPSSPPRMLPTLPHRHHKVTLSQKPVTKLRLKKIRDSDSWYVPMAHISPVPPISSNPFLANIWPSPDDNTSFPASGSTSSEPVIASTSGMQMLSTNASGTESIILSSDDENIESAENMEVNDDECMIVQELKPRALRTPEIVDLSSDSGTERPASSFFLELESISDGSFGSLDVDVNNMMKNNSPIVIGIADSSQTLSGREEGETSDHHNKKRREKHRSKAHTKAQKKKQTSADKSQNMCRWSSSSSRSPIRDNGHGAGSSKDIDSVTLRNRAWNERLLTSRPLRGKARKRTDPNPTIHDAWRNKFLPPRYRIYPEEEYEEPSRDIDVNASEAKSWEVESPTDVCSKSPKYDGWEAGSSTDICSRSSRDGTASRSPQDGCLNSPKNTSQPTIMDIASQLSRHKTKKSARPSSSKSPKHRTSRSSRDGTSTSPRSKHSKLSKNSNLPAFHHIIQNRQPKMLTLIENERVNYPGTQEFNGERSNIFHTVDTTAFPPEVECASPNSVSNIKEANVCNVVAEETVNHQSDSSPNSSRSKTHKAKKRKKKTHAKRKHSKR